MKRNRFALMALVALLVGGCSTFDAIKHANIGSDFDKTSRAYVHLVRWHELESAMVSYVSMPLREDYRKRIEAAGELQVVDSRIKEMECDPVRGVAALKVEFDYYRPPSTRVLTVVDNQKWSYEDENGGRFWRLQSPLPEFK